MDIKYDYWWASMQCNFFHQINKIAIAAGGSRRLYEMSEKELVNLAGVSENYARDIVEMEADEDEEAIPELETEEFEDKDVYLLLADTITGMNYVLGEYDTLEEAEIARNKLVEWLQHEMYGVYDMKKEE